MIKLRKNIKGFTILELLIATIIFTVVLLISSAAMVGLSRQFYKGLNKSKTQEVARSISEEIAKNIQYSKVAPMPIAGGPAGTSTWCIANTRYTFRTGAQLSASPSDALNTASPAVLLRANGCNAKSGAMVRAADEAELMGEGMRLSALEITSDAPGKVWQIRVKVATGTDDQMNNPTNANATCKNQSGQQFCAVSEFTLIVVRNM